MPPAAVEGPSIESITETSAVVTWTTDMPTVGGVEYELTEHLGRTRPRKPDKEAMRHRVRLDNLDPSKTYLLARPKQQRERRGGDRGDPLRPVGDSSIEVDKVICPVDYTCSDYYAACHDSGQSDVTFTLEGNNGYQGSETTEVVRSPGPGFAAFAELEAGFYHLREYNTGTDGQVVIYCSADDGQTMVAQSADSPAMGLGLDLPAETHVVCDWYTVSGSCSGIEGSPCSSDAECCPEFTCFTAFEGVCRPLCGSDADWPAGQIYCTNLIPAMCDVECGSP